MAEQSIGMTTGSGDGTVGGYVNTRMTEKDLYQIGNGLLSESGANLSGVGTSTLQIFPVQINVNGYFYVNTSTLSIDASSVVSGTYYLVCKVNDTAAAVSVIRSATGTTIPLRSVRLCLITTASAGANDLILSTVVVSGGLISSASLMGTAPHSSWAESRTLNVVEYANKLDTSTTAVIANTPLSLSTSGTSSSRNVITLNPITLRFEGWYTVSGYIKWRSTEAGYRTINITHTNLPTYEQSNTKDSLQGASGTPVFQNFNHHIRVSSGSTDVVTISVTSSITTEMLGYAFRVIRL